MLGEHFWQSSKHGYKHSYSAYDHITHIAELVNFQDSLVL